MRGDEPPLHEKRNDEREHEELNLLRLDCEKLLVEIHRSFGLTRARPWRRFLNLMIILSKLLLVISLIGLLQCSGKFRKASRAFDERALASLKQMMSMTESMGYPSQLAPILILLGALFFVLAGAH